MQELKGDVQELKGDVQGLKGGVQGLKGEMRGLQGSMRLLSYTVDQNHEQFLEFREEMIDFKDTTLTRFDYLYKHADEMKIEFGLLSQHLRITEDTVTELKYLPQEVRTLKVRFDRFEEVHS